MLSPSPSRTQLSTQCDLENREPDCTTPLLKALQSFPPHLENKANVLIGLQGPIRPGPLPPLFLYLFELISRYSPHYS